MKCRDDEKQTPLRVTARNGASRAMLEQYLSLHHEINLLDAFQRTPLHWTAINGHRNTVVSLFEFGANVYLKDENEEIPLNCAERRALYASKERVNGERSSVFADIAVALGGGASTQYLRNRKG